MRTDSASLTCFRQCMADSNRLGTASACLTHLAVVNDILAPIGSPLNTTSVTVAPCGNRQRFPYGGNHEQRIRRSPTGDQTALGRSVGRGHLSHRGSLARLVPSLVAALSSARPQRTVRPHAGQYPTAPHPARAGAYRLEHPPAAGVADASRHTVPSHWGQCDSSRTPEFAHSASAQCAHHRTGTPAPWGQPAQSAARSVLTAPHLSRTPRRRVQSTASGGLRGTDLPQGQSATLLHLCRQRCLRWRGVLENLPFPQDGHRPRLPGRMLEEPRPSRPSAIRQCPRSRRLGASGALSLAGHSPVLALRRRAGVHPTRTASTQWQRRALQRLVPTTPVPTSLYASEHPQARTATPARHGQYPACPATLGRVDSRAVSAPPQVAAVTPTLHSADRAAADCCRTSHLHPASHAQWQCACAQPDLQRRQAAEG